MACTAGVAVRRLVPIILQLRDCSGAYSASLVAAAADAIAIDVEHARLSCDTKWVPGIDHRGGDGFGLHLAGQGQDGRPRPTDDCTIGSGFDGGCPHRLLTGNEQLAIGLVELVVKGDCERLAIAAR